MKKIHIVIGLLFIISFPKSLKSQGIDSVSITISKSRPDSQPWDYDWMNTDSFSNGLIISSNVRSWSNNSWINSSFSVFDYSMNILSEKITQLWNGSQWVNNRRLIFYSSSIDSVLEMQWIGSWENDLLNITYKNSLALDSLILTKEWLNSNWSNNKMIENNFFVDSSILSQTISFWNSSTLQWEGNKRYLWLKDSLGRDTSFITQDFIGGIWHNHLMDFFVYDSAGIRIEEINYSWQDLDSTWGFDFDHSYFSYDSLNRLILITGHPNPGGPYFIEYTFDSLGNLVNKYENWSTQGGFVTQYNLHFYNLLFPHSSEIYLLIIDDYEICSNQSIPIGAFSFGGNVPLHFNWTPSAGLSSDTIENPNVFIDSATTYVLTVTDSIGLVKSDTINIAVFSSANIVNVLANSTSCTGCHDGSFEIDVVNVRGFLQLSINPNPGAVISNLFNSISNLPSGIYTICMVNSNNCQYCFVDTIVDGTLGINEDEKKIIYFMENPFNNQTGLYYANPPANSRLDLFDVLGRVVRTLKINSEITRINRHGLSSGTYTCLIYADDEIVHRMKLVIVD